MKSQLLLMALLLINVPAASAKGDTTFLGTIGQSHLTKAPIRTSSTPQFLSVERNMDGAKSLRATSDETVYPIANQKEQYLGQIDLLNEQAEAVDRQMELLLVESVDCCDKEKQTQIKLQVQSLYSQLELIDKKINRLRIQISQ